MVILFSLQVEKREREIHYEWELPVGAADVVAVVVGRGKNLINPKFLTQIFLTQMFGLF